MKLEVIILAAGQGTRMRSKYPKVLHCVAGKPMLSHVIDTAKELAASAIHVVIGHGAEQIKDSIDEPGLQWAVQEQQLGTGHAVAQAMPAVANDTIVLVAYGDVPLVKTSTLAGLLESVDENTLSLLTVNHDNPTGYGRIVRDQQQKILAIVEEKDADSQQRKISEINTGILAVRATKLRQWLPLLSAENVQKEYYLTDIIGMAVADGMQVTAHQPESVIEVEGANNRQQVATLERYYQLQQANNLMSHGVTLADPGRIDIRGTLTVGQDSFIDVNCIFIGDVTIGEDATIGPNCVIKDSSVGNGTVIKANTVIEDSIIANHCEVGPFARLRPGANLADKSKIGNFVEAKNTNIGVGSKVNHLSYVGDSNIGQGVNVGAGTITCNYDGANKYTTNIGDGAFIGSNTSLVAPVNIGELSTVAAGSTITGDIGSKQLSVARARQKNLDNWKRPVKKK